MPCQTSWQSDAGASAARMPGRRRRWPPPRRRLKMSIVGGGRYGGYMSLAESPESGAGHSTGHIDPESARAGGAATANHLRDTVLPVRPALIDRGSAARLKPEMLDELLRTSGVQAMVLSRRQALV